jgi:hypothetical protein
MSTYYIIAVLEIFLVFKVISVFYLLILKIDCITEYLLILKIDCIPERANN